MERAEIQWGDEIGLRSDYQTRTTYSPRDKTLMLRAGKRFGCNMISTVAGRGKLSLMIFRERFTADVYIRLLRRLMRQGNRKVYRIIAGHPVHRSKKVATWLDSHCDRIQMIGLTGCSPDLNPDEMLNNDVKSIAVGRRRPSDMGEMRSSVRGYQGQRAQIGKPGNL